jgi:SAM-dependent methyltransferase
VSYNARKQYFKSTYPEVFNSGLIGRAMKLQHKSLEIGIPKTRVKSVLELGAGAGNHVQNLHHEFDVYHETDLFVKSPKLNENSEKIIRFRLDATKISKIRDCTYDRVIVSCLLIHLDDPKKAVNEWLRIVKPGGYLSILVPCEPGIFLRFMRQITTVRKTRKKNIKYFDIHYSEHKTFFLRLKYIIDSIENTSDVKWRYFPFIIPFWNLNLWSTAQIKK